VTAFSNRDALFAKHCGNYDKPIHNIYVILKLSCFVEHTNITIPTCFS